MYTHKEWKSINQNTRLASLPLQLVDKMEVLSLPNYLWQLIVAGSFEKDRFIMM